MAKRSIPLRNILRFAKNCSSLTVQEIHSEIAEIKSLLQNNGVHTEAFVGEKKWEFIRLLLLCQRKKNWDQNKNKAQRSFVLYNSSWILYCQRYCGAFLVCYLDYGDCEKSPARKEVSRGCYTFILTDPLERILPRRRYLSSVALVVILLSFLLTVKWLPSILA